MCIDLLGLGRQDVFHNRLQERINDKGILVQPQTLPFFICIQVVLFTKPKAIPRGIFRHPSGGLNQADINILALMRGFGPDYNGVSNDYVRMFAARMLSSQAQLLELLDNDTIRNWSYPTQSAIGS